jgi:hypothetical protein
MKRLRRANGSTAPDGRHFPPPTALEVIRHITRSHALDPRLEPTDRHLHRWAASQGSGLPLDPDLADILPRVRVPPLSDDIAVVTDQIVLHSPEYWKRFVFKWYRSPKPKEVIAQELGMRVQAVYDERRLALAYMFGRLTEAGVAIPSYQLR